MYLVLALLGVPARGAGQASEPGPPLFFGTPAELSIAQRALAIEGARELGGSAPGDHREGQVVWVSADNWPPDPGVTSAELAPLREVAQLLSAARRSAARLDERSALRSLAAAQRLAWEALSVPGATAFCAEVELQLAVTAAQAGRWELAADSLARAARLDASRRLLAAEASPAVVALAERVFRDAASGAEGEWPISADAERARIFVDDVDHGFAPQRVRLRVGSHALRIEAAGHLPYHARIEVAQGSRPAQRFVLAPDPRALAKAALQSALQHDPASLPAAARALLMAAGEFGSIVIVESDPGLARSLVLSCDARGCRAPLWLSAERRQPSRPALAFDADSLQAARAWLRTPQAALVTRAAAARAVTPIWRRWYVWSALAALAVGTGAATAAVLAAEPTRALRVVVDAGQLR